jgi:hypothetical protein
MFKLLRNAVMLVVLAAVAIGPSPALADQCPSCGDCTCCNCKECSKSWTGSCKCKGCSVSVEGEELDFAF